MHASVYAGVDPVWKLNAREVEPPGKVDCEIRGQSRFEKRKPELEQAMDLQELHRVAEALAAPGKGLLAADESFGTIKKRFEAVGVESTEANRREYREILFSDTAALGEYISGVILFDETIHQETREGRPLVELITSSGAIPGIKVDRGAKPLPFADGELVTEGLDGLRERLQEYRVLGARFSKWRAVIDIGRDGNQNMPSHHCVRTNVHALARFAALSQEQDLVPVVEPDVLMDGDHNIGRCAEVTEWVLRRLFHELHEHRVSLEGVVLKPNMIVPGKNAAHKASPEEVADATVKCFHRAIPSAVAGVVLLSGGQSEVEATANLNAVNAANFTLPWPVSFSFGRALQMSVLETWAGEMQNIAAAQKVFAHRARMNGLAVKGEWHPSLEQELG